MSILTIGIDIGSRTVKAVIFDAETKAIRSSLRGDTTADPRKASQDLYERLLREAGVSARDVSATVATGYSREQFPFADRRYTEIACHAAGVHFFFPGGRTIIDIGGQDSKVIRTSQGSVSDFAMNDRCAAGTGRFLEVVERILEIPLSSMEEVAQSSDNPCEISSMCVVFAESEIVSLLAQGRSRSDILAGVAKSLAHRIFSLSSKTGTQEPLVFTGGVARNGAVTRALMNIFKMEIFVPENPFITGALGAALLAARMAGEKSATS
ncbi:MAG: acyl-CoA dehydratase activase [Candidatus Eremiobacteraeota bacterium]|nr:acyl-CoA dehydratase activase [Candidatus Eremiobacteraeota bacterium]